MDEIIVTELQLKKLKELWFLYGNGGDKHTLANHRFLQDLIVLRKDTREFRKYSRIKSSDFILSEELLIEVDKILNA